MEHIRISSIFDCDCIAAKDSNGIVHILNTEDNTFYQFDVPVKFFDFYDSRIIGIDFENNFVVGCIDANIHELKCCHKIGFNANSFCVSGGVIVLLSDDGILYKIKLTDYMQDTNPGRHAYSHIKMPGDIAVKKIHGGINSILIYTADNQLYLFDYNETMRKYECIDTRYINAASCYYSMFIALADNGDIYFDNGKCVRTLEYEDKIYNSICFRHFFIYGHIVFYLAEDKNIYGISNKKMTGPYVTLDEPILHIYCDILDKIYILTVNGKLFVSDIHYDYRIKEITAFGDNGVSLLQKTITCKSARKNI